MHPSTECTLHDCIIMSAVLTRRIENILNHMDYTVCCHQVTVRHIHRVDMNGVVYLGKTEKKQCMYIYFLKRINKHILILWATSITVEIIYTVLRPFWNGLTWEVLLWIPGSVLCCWKGHLRIQFLQSKVEVTKGGHAEPVRERVSLLLCLQAPPLTHWIEPHQSSFKKTLMLPWIIVHSW